MLPPLLITHLALPLGELAKIFDFCLRGQLPQFYDKALSVSLFG